ncbi:hypothetical protein LINGRAHAP2_LOCUS33255 [Linum grandiflorum]
MVCCKRNCRVVYTHYLLSRRRLLKFKLYRDEG